MCRETGVMQNYCRKISRHWAEEERVVDQTLKLFSIYWRWKINKSRLDINKLFVNNLNPGKDQEKIENWVKRYFICWKQKRFTNSDINSFGFCSYLHYLTPGGLLFSLVTPPCSVLWRLLRKITFDAFPKVRTLVKI